MCNCFEEKEKALAERFGYRSVTIDKDYVSGRAAIEFGGIDKNGKNSLVRK